jgi:S1-C subfamily serine protease
MSGIKHSNGHKPLGLAHVFDPMFTAAARPEPDQLAFDLDAALAPVLHLRAQAPDDAFSSSYLGTEREGNGILIGDDGLVVTIGYLITEAETVILGVNGGTTVHAHVIAYDYETGFGLLRAGGELGVEPLELGDSSDVIEQETLIIGAHGGRGQAINAVVASKREFAGYWEYMLDEAIFTTPPHPHWSGSALIDDNGKLVGVGSLFVQDAVEDDVSNAGNMFLPIDLLKSVLDELLEYGHRTGPVRPWMGIYSMEALGRVLITSISAEGPADVSGIEAGDVLLAVNGLHVSGLADLYRKVWSAGQAGVTVSLGILRDDEMLNISVETADRTKFMKQPSSH